MLSGVALQALEVPDYAMRVVCEDRLADEFEQCPEDPPAGAVFEVADPDHLDLASGLG
jgi:hypothetical protein